MSRKLPKITIRGVECYLDSRLDEIRPVTHPHISVKFDGPNSDEDYPPEFKALPGYKEED